MASAGSQWMRLVRNVVNEKGLKASADPLVEKLKSLQRLMMQLQPEHFRLTSEVAEKDWTYGEQRIKSACIEIEHAQNYNVCVFLLRPNYRIPLHDHPGMHGLMKVLFGKMSLQSYSPLESTSNGTSNGFSETTSPRNHIQSHNAHSNGSMLYTHKLERSVTLTTESIPCVLYPHNGNIHEIEALDEPVAFLDILMPPYNPEQGRDCNYYTRAKVSQDEALVHLRQVPSSYHGFCCIPLEHDVGF